MVFTRKTMSQSRFQELNLAAGDTNRQFSSPKVHSLIKNDAIHIYLETKSYSKLSLRKNGTNTKV